QADAGLRDLLDQEGGAALRAGLGDRAIPGHEVALGLAVVRAAEEHLAAARALLGQIPAAAGARAGHAQRDGAGGLALGVARAGEELAETPALDQHGRLAGLALLVGGGLRRDLDGAVFAPQELTRVLAVGVARAGQELAVAAP